MLTGAYPQRSGIISNEWVDPQTRQPVYNTMDPAYHYIGHKTAALAGTSPRMLLAETNETVHLSVLSGDEVIYIDKLDSPEPVRAYSVIGGRAPAYCVATGKALLAWREQPAVQLMTVRPLQVYTPTTLADTSALAMELDRVRQQGYAVNRGEWRASVWGIAAPVFDERQRVVAALGISGPAERIRARGVKRLAELVVQAARQASSRQLALAGEAR